MSLYYEHDRMNLPSSVVLFAARCCHRFCSLWRPSTGTIFTATFLEGKKKALHSYIHTDTRYTTRIPGNVTERKVIIENDGKSSTASKNIPQVNLKRNEYFLFAANKIFVLTRGRKEKNNRSFRHF